MWKEVLDNVLRETLQSFGQRLQAFGPNLLAMMVILATGIVCAGLIRYVVKWLLSRIGFDRFAERLGLAVLLQKGGITKPPSAVVSAVLAWGVMGVFVLLAIGALNIQIADRLLSQAFAYLPQVFVAAAILVLGSLVSAFLRRSVLIAAVNAGLESARLLAAGVHTALMVLVAAMALEHLGVGRQVIVVSFAVLFGGVVFALALAFGLAGQGLAREALEHLARKRGGEKKDETMHHL
jgi:hypothetical protein